jgi:hypothetical protein
MIQNEKIMKKKVLLFLKWINLIWNTIRSEEKRFPELVEKYIIK